MEHISWLNPIIVPHPTRLKIQPTFLFSPRKKNHDDERDPFTKQSNPILLVLIHSLIGGNLFNTFIPPTSTDDDDE